MNRNFINSVAIRAWSSYCMGIFCIQWIAIVGWERGIPPGPVCNSPPMLEGSDACWLRSAEGESVSSIGPLGIRLRRPVDPDTGRFRAADRAPSHVDGVAATSFPLCLCGRTRPASAAPPVAPLPPHAAAPTPPPCRERSRSRHARLHLTEAVGVQALGQRQQPLHAFHHGRVRLGPLPHALPAGREAGVRQAWRAYSSGLKSVPAYSDEEYRCSY